MMRRPVHVATRHTVISWAPSCEDVERGEIAVCSATNRVCMAVHAHQAFGRRTSRMHELCQLRQDPRTVLFSSTPGGGAAARDMRASILQQQILLRFYKPGACACRLSLTLLEGSLLKSFDLLWTKLLWIFLSWCPFRTPGMNYIS